MPKIKSKEAEATKQKPYGKYAPVLASKRLISPL
jgi:hypothetical protein